MPDISIKEATIDDADEFIGLEEKSAVGHTPGQNPKRNFWKTSVDKS